MNEININKENKRNLLIIGGVKLANKIWLAPLAGVTTAPVREFFSSLGAGLTHTEMISCMGLLRNNNKTEKMLLLLPKENNVVLQLFSGDAETIVKGAEAALAISANMNSMRFAALGINMACPMPKVTKRGAGAALMTASEIASEMTRNLKNLGLPVWIKTRVSHNISETLRFIELLVKAGADNICIHGRTPSQRYEGRADRNKIHIIAQHFPDKISASGDVYTTEDIKEYLNMGCVGVMLARGAMANPYLFPQALLISELANPTQEKRLLHLRLLGERIREILGPSQAVVLIKRILAGTLKGMPGAAELRRKVGTATDLDELMRLII